MQAHPERYAELRGLPSLNKMIADLQSLARPSTAKEVLVKKHWKEREVSVEDLCQLAKQILWHGPARGHNEVELSHLAPELAALVMMHFGQGDQELELEE